MKLQTKNLSKYRKEQWLQQNKICPICNTHINEDDAVLDHDHDGGNCRMVLHRSCNTVEGKIKKSYIRYVSKRQGIDFITFLENLTKYIKDDYSQNPIHPTELTENEKELKRINKRLKSLKQPSTIKKYKDQAKILRKIIKEERKTQGC